MILTRRVETAAKTTRLTRVLFWMVNMTIDLKWLIGNRTKGIGKQDYTWFFAFDGGSSITTESTWRLITVEGIRATSDDHGQQFGLPAPFDAIDVVKKAIGQHAIKQYNIDPTTIRGKPQAA